MLSESWNPARSVFLGLWGWTCFLCEFQCKHVVMRWAKKQVNQNEVPKKCELWDTSWCFSDSQTRSIFHLLASWFHLYLRKDKEFCSGNVSPYSQASFLSSWWIGMEGMHLSAGISWCPGTNGSHVLICPLSTLGGKKTWWRGCCAGRGVQNKLSQFQPAVTCQWIPTMASGSVNMEARNMPNDRGRVTSRRQGIPSLQVRSKL